MIMIAVTIIIVMVRPGRGALRRGPVRGQGRALAVVVVVLEAGVGGVVVAVWRWLLVRE